ncbi:MAG: hypothetical protein GVY02_04855 [Bacteroidetes bacterium]|jgi:bacterioferritin-associated ferredoxin|nr:hypothetical protein [Bacteroidota bacterium]
MPVERCICHKISFATIKQIAANNGLETIEELREKNICSTNCQMCAPYILRMLETGETSFQPGTHSLKKDR